VPRHHTKDKGDLAVAQVYADLVGRGAVVLVPMTEHAPFDIVAYLDGSFFRVQVKYRRAVNGAVRVEFASTWSDRKGVHRRPMPRTEVDVLAIYCPDSEATYYLNPSDHRSSVTLRITSARNGQRRGVLEATRFLAMPPLYSLPGRTHRVGADLPAI
jgi:hypothetical protein